MKKLWTSLLVSGALITMMTECKTQHVKLEQLTLANKNVFSTNTYLYIDTMPCSNGNTEVIVRLVGTPKSGQYTHTSSLYVPTSLSRSGKVGHYTHTYMYTFREITEPLACKLIITTITYPDAGHTSYVPQTTAEYYFEIEPLTGILKWINFWS